MVEFLPVNKVHIPDGRLRQVDDEWAAFLGAAMLEVGQKTPIDVIAEGEGFRLVAGGHRLRGAQIVKMKQIEARILTPQEGESADDLRLHEIMENLARKDFNALERCEALYELKRIYEAKHPIAKHGGDRKSQVAKNKAENQVAIFAFCSSAAESTGLSRRSVELAVQIFEGLSPATRERLRGSALALKQSELKALSAKTQQEQSMLLDLLLGPVKAGDSEDGEGEGEDTRPNNVAEAERLVNGLPVLSDNDKILRATQGGLVKLTKTTRQILFETYKDEILELVRAKGWLHG
ncbi:ParB N-terminal domain-containing protein [Labrenzia suaedae]|uniref:ParB N-terminal domain-containing protein n=2 Tax=Roseibium litorale TaxID=2803841 RepID=A0ABR9CH42_9HYPH|nr:ParB N-terminal domain-containing protein [Roseibium litorale]